MNQEEVWKAIQIEHISGYEVSNLGRVRKFIGSKQKYKYLANKLSGNHYAFGVVELGVNRSLARTVCATFHGEAPGSHRDFDVAHRDGNTLNNAADNIYWISKADHRKLQFDSDQYSNNVHIDVKDILDPSVLDSDEPQPYIVHHFVSLDKTAKFLEVPSSSITSMIKNYKDIPYKGQYFISTPTPDRLFTVNRNDRRGIVFLNHYTGEIGEADSVPKASYMTGVKTADIFNRCRSRDILSPIRGYEFHYATDKRPWTLFNDTEIMKSIRKYEMKLYGKILTR